MKLAIFTRERLAVPALLLALVVLAGSPTAAFAQPVAREDAWVPVVLVYHSDVKGKVEPCG
ncbi:MAG: hypothetical protein R6X25_10650 [Candidatus Krumholzibacteriia bacterium]